MRETATPFLYRLETGDVATYGRLHRRQRGEYLAPSGSLPFSRCLAVPEWLECSLLVDGELACPGETWWEDPNGGDPEDGGEERWRCIELPWEPGAEGSPVMELAMHRPLHGEGGPVVSSESFLRQTAEAFALLATDHRAMDESARPRPQPPGQEWRIQEEEIRPWMGIYVARRDNAVWEASDSASGSVSGPEPEAWLPAKNVPLMRIWTVFAHPVMRRGPDVGFAGRPVKMEAVVSAPNADWPILRSYPCNLSPGWVDEDLVEAAGFSYQAVEALWNSLPEEDGRKKYSGTFYGSLEEFVSGVAGVPTPIPPLRQEGGLYRYARGGDPWDGGGFLVWASRPSGLGTDTRFLALWRPGPDVVSELASLQEEYPERGLRLRFRYFVEGDGEEKSPWSPGVLLKINHPPKPPTELSMEIRY